MPDATTHPGWYPDPDGGPRRRFWDGSRWTVHYEPPPKWRDRTLAHFEQAPVRKSQQSPRGWIIAAGIATAVFVVGFGACAFVASQVHIGTRYLNPIPVPPTSCPYLQRVHDTAVVAGEASGAATYDNDPRAWKTHAASIGHKLTAFDIALRAAAAHTPAPIAAKLQDVHEQVTVGLTQLGQARTGGDWSGSSFGAVTHGYSSLSDASDLTGNACGFTVAPSMDVFLNQMTVAPR